MKKIFISGPYTKGDVAVNVANHMRAFNTLLLHGYAPFNPLLFHFQHMVHPRLYDTWLSLDIEYLRICDAVLVLPGESKGSEIEIAEAKRCLIPVYYSLTKLMQNELH